MLSGNRWWRRSRSAAGKTSRSAALGTVGERLSLPESKPPREKADPQEDPERAKWKRFWKHYGDVSLEERVAICREHISAEDFTADFGFDLFESLVPALQREGLFHIIRDLLTAIRERHPEDYNEQAQWFAEWSIETILFSGEGDLTAPLAVFARDPIESFDTFSRVRRLLMYHGRSAELLQAMLEGWPSVKETSEILPHGIGAYEAECFLLSLFEYLDQHPQASPEDVVALRVPGIEWPSSTSQREALGDYLTGQSSRTWTAEQFSPRRNREELCDDLYFLSLDWMQSSRSVHGVPWCRTELIRYEVLNFYLEQFDEDAPGPRARGGRRGSKKVRESNSLLLLDVPSVDAYMAQRMSPLAFSPYLLAALWVGLPSFCTFAADRGLISHVPVRKLQVLGRTFVSAMEGRTFDPVVLSDIRTSWDTWRKIEHAP